MNIQVRGLEPIKALSYWRFTKLRHCQLRGAFPGSVVGPELPAPAAGRPQALGTLYHKLMEGFHNLAKSGRLSGSDLRSDFNAIVEAQALKISQDPALRHLGDPRQWRELTPIYRALSDMLARRTAARGASGIEVHTEDRIFARDGLLFGDLDAYFLRPEGIDLVDYKSGRMDDEGILKEDYVNQLYFYAYLIEQKHGIYPRSVTLVGKDQSAISIPAAPDKSYALADEMRSVLFSYNQKVAKERDVEKFAFPNSRNCAYCDAKPVCNAFWKALHSLETSSYCHVTQGIQAVPFRRSQIGCAMLELDQEAGTIAAGRLKISRLYELRYPYLKDKVGQRMLITNLRHIDSSKAPMAEVTDRSQIIILGNGI